MDYAAQAEVTRHADWAAFEAGAGRIVLLTTGGGVRLDRARFAGADTLLLGSESAGVPRHVHDRAALRVRIPMRAGFRSLNVAVAGAMALGEALRQTRSEEHTSELQSLMRTSYAVFCLKKKNTTTTVYIDITAITT